MRCPYCFSKLPLNSDLKKCESCQTELSKKILKNIQEENITLSLIGDKKVGKTTYLSMLFYYLEEVFTIQTNITYEYLNEESFPYILENIKNIKNKESSNTNLEKLENVLTLWKYFFFKKNIVSIFDLTGKIIEEGENTINTKLSKKILNSKNIFLFIDSESFFQDNGIVYTGSISKYLNKREEENSNNNKNIYLIFTKIDKIDNNKKYPMIKEYLSFCEEIREKLNENNLKTFYEKISNFSNKNKKNIKNTTKRNFINILEENFENVECFFVSNLDDKNLNSKKAFEILNPFICLMGKEYYSKSFFYNLKKRLTNNR